MTRAPRRPRRLATPLAALLAVLSVLFPTGGLLDGAGTGPLTTAPASVVAAASVPSSTPGTAASGTPVTPVDAARTPHTAPHADDHPCPTPCAAQARTRHEHLGDRPAPPDQHVTPPSPGTAAPAAVRTAARPAYPPPLSARRATHDRGRAPPAPSGT
ncbi:hypothetical protein [Streptomyces fumanus]|uniref:hypothetical protein n=1 Tax=Streptomyces fumanus TaxID=67302 RepID=UPI00340C3EBE